MEATIDAVLARVREQLADEPVVDVDAAATSMIRAFRATAHRDRWISGAELGRRLGVSKQAVHQRAARGTLLVVADAEGVRYPAWQVVDGALPRGLAHLVKVARRSGWSDTDLAVWIDESKERVRLVREGRAQELAGRLNQRRAEVTRRKVGGEPLLCHDTVVQ